MADEFGDTELTDEEAQAFADLLNAMAGVTHEYTNDGALGNWHADLNGAEYSTVTVTSVDIPAGTPVVVAAKAVGPFGGMFPLAFAPIHEVKFDVDGPADVSEFLVNPDSLTDEQWAAIEEAAELNGNFSS